MYINWTSKFVEQKKWFFCSVLSVSTWNKNFKKPYCLSPVCCQFHSMIIMVHIFQCFISSVLLAHLKLDKIIYFITRLLSETGNTHRQYFQTVTRMTFSHQSIVTELTICLQKLTVLWKYGTFIVSCTFFLEVCFPVSVSIFPVNYTYCQTVSSLLTAAWRSNVSLLPELIFVGGDRLARGMTLSVPNQVLLFVIWLRTYLRFHILSCLLNIIVSSVKSPIKQMFGSTEQKVSYFVKWPRLKQNGDENVVTVTECRFMCSSRNW